MVKRSFTVWCICVSFLLEASAQTKYIGLDEVFRLAEESNKSIRSYRTGVQEAKQAVKVAKNDRLPSVEASLSFSYLGDGWMSDRNFSNGQRAAMPHYGNNFAFQATQVIYSGGLISRNIEMAELTEQIAELQLENNRQDIRFLLAGYYLELYKLNNRRRVYEKNIASTELLLQEIRASHEQGTALKSDITRYELQLEDLKLGLTETENRTLVLNRQLTTALGLDISVLLIPDTLLNAKSVERLGEAYWQEGRTSSPVLQLSWKNIEISKKQQEMVRAERRPTIGLTIADHLDGPITIEVPPIDKNFNYWYAGIGISYKFDALYKGKRKMKQAKLAVRRAEEDHSLADEHLSNQVHEAYIGLEESFVRLQTKEKSVQLSNENYEVVHHRYKNGLAIITDMLDASNILLSSELDLANSQIDILYQYFLLKKTAGIL